MIAAIFSPKRAKTAIQRILFGVICLWLAVAGTATPAAKAETVAILLSQEIRPYLQAVAGIQEALAEAEKETVLFNLEDFSGRSRAVLAGRLKEKSAFSLAVAVGPEAARFADAQNFSFPFLYTMVLNPRAILDRAACGISLRIPVSVQLDKIHQALPDVKRIGILYDPEYNREFFQKAVQSRTKGVTVVPLAAGSTTDIPQLLKANWEKMDGLWLIPDRTVISESIVQYIIKQALLQRIPVIGYNRFFYESGAAVAFVFEYQQIGVQTGTLALAVMAGQPCESPVPWFETWLHPRVIQRLGIEAVWEKGAQKGP